MSEEFTLEEPCHCCSELIDIPCCKREGHQSKLDKQGVVEEDDKYLLLTRAKPPEAATLGVLYIVEPIAMDL